MKQLMGLNSLQFFMQMPNWVSVLLTWRSTVNLFLSSNGLPRAPGYSQSRSSPSKPCCLRNLMEDWMNTWRLVGDEAMMVNLWTFKYVIGCRKILDFFFIVLMKFGPTNSHQQNVLFSFQTHCVVPKFHPPTANRVFS